MRRTAIVVAMLVGLAGCGGGRNGGDDDDDDGGGSCASAGRTLCERACACTDGDECAITSSPEGGVRISFDDEDDCVALYVTLGCQGGGDASVDYAACAAALETAECAEGTGEESAFVSPPECDSQDD